MIEIRISRLPMIATCGYRYMRMENTEETSEAIQTGQLFHEMVHRFHNQLGQTDFFRYPLANFSEAQEMFAAYTADPKTKTVVQTEIEISHEFPSMGLRLRGHIDQIREDENGRLWVWDIKTGKTWDRQMLGEYIPQLLGYAYVGSRVLNVPLGVGGILCARNYLKNRSPYLEEFIYPNEVETLFRHVLMSASAVVHGLAVPNPGNHCRYCPLSNGGKLGGCMRSVEHV